MTDLDLAFTSASEVARRISSRDLSPVEIVENTLARIAEVNPDLNCFCFVYPEESLQLAREAEKAVIRGDDLGSLHGVPIAIKDLTPTAGKRTTLGSAAFEHNVPTVDATIVERLRAAGAIMVGKTTTPEFAHSSFTESPLWGITRNPWNLDRSPGGSSGGSGAAVASGCVPLAEGTDMGGSVRIPASWCGIVGLKPTHGRIPMDLLPSAWDDISHFGPLARTIDDACLFLRAAEGPSDRDPLSLPALGGLDRPFDGDLTGMRLALDLDLGCYYLNPQVEASVREAAALLESQRGGRRGGRHRLDRPDRRCLGPLLGGLHGRLLRRTCLTSTGSGWTRESSSSSRAATPCRRSTTSDSRSSGRHGGTTSPASTPTTTRCSARRCPSRRHRSAEYDEYSETDDGLFRSLDMTSQFNFFPRCPAISIPCGWTTDGLPIGLQAVVRRHRDDVALQIGRAMEVAKPWAQMRPTLV